MNVYVNGEVTPSRFLREEELGPLARLNDGVCRVFLLLECAPCRGGDDITCDYPPSQIDQVWVRFPYRNKDSVAFGNMRIFPE